MIKIIFKIRIIIILAISCAPKPIVKEADCSDEKLFCTKGMMQQAAYWDYKRINAIPKLQRGQFENGFSIVVDTHLKIYNKSQNQVWLVNNSMDTIELQVQRNSLVGVLQAKTKENTWKSVEYWNFAGCGWSYSSTDILPHKAMRLLTPLPNKGDFKTQFRYKILGGKQYYYSNEFDGAIDYCHFVEDSSTYDDRYVGGLRPHFTLDTFFYATFYK